VASYPWSNYLGTIVMTDRELMQMASEEDVCETPLVELLESVPKNARMIYEHSEFDSENIPVGDLCHKAAKALRDRLAQPEPDAVLAEREACAKIVEDWPNALSFYKPRWWDIKIKWILVGHKAASKLLANAIRERGENDRLAQPDREWVGLTDEEVGGLTVFSNGLHDVEVPILADLIRAVEAKLKEKNT
jgi:hypothetical protein